MTTVGEASRAALFFDVDGTLMGGDRPSFKQGEPMPKLSVEAFMAERPSDVVMAAFGRLRAQGHAPFICTGRPFFMITPGVRALEPVGYVAEAGAYVRIGDEVIRDEHIPRDLVRETAARFVEAGVNVQLESNETANAPSRGVPRCARSMSSSRISHATILPSLAPMAWGASASSGSFPFWRSTSR